MMVLKTICEWLAGRDAKRRAARLRRLAGLVATMAVCLFIGAGCAAVRGREYGHVLFPSVEHFRVQVIHPGDPQEWPLRIDRLLLLPPVGDAPPAFLDLLHHKMRGELQQILPTVVRTPQVSGLYAAYMTKDNLLTDEGGLAVDEIVRIGVAAEATHVMSVRINEFRPYHPQRIFMEWTLIEVDGASKQLMLVGGMDASEQTVLIAADAYLRQRKARPYNTANLDMLLRSPRDYCGFAVAQAVDTLCGRIAPSPDLTVDTLKPSPRYGDNIHRNRKQGDHHAYR